MSSPALSVPDASAPVTGHIFWLFGLSGAGKSTLAGILSAKLRRPPGLGLLMLDGDRLRHGLSEGLGFSEADRSENLRRAAEVARLGVESGLVVIAAFITPQESQRRRIREIAGPGNVSLVWVNATLDVCRRRDVKGLYARAAAGTTKNMTGVSAAFEAPAAPDLMLETGREPIVESVARLAAFAEAVLGAGRRSAAVSGTPSPGQAMGPLKQAMTRNDVVANGSAKNPGRSPTVPRSGPGIS